MRAARTSAMVRAGHVMLHAPAAQVVSACSAAPAYLRATALIESSKSRNTDRATEKALCSAMGNLDVPSQLKYREVVSLVVTA